MPRVERLSEHQHSFHQLLLYLRGLGEQHLGSSSKSVARGSLLFIPSETRHRFQKSGTIRPVCLAIDFETNEASSWPEETILSASELSEVERLLVAIHEYESSRNKESIELVTLILQLLETMRHAIRRGQGASPRGPIQFAIENHIEKNGFDTITPGKIAAHLDRTLDHLNRQLRAECGTTVGALLNRKKAERAGALLRSSRKSIGEVGSEIGMHDQNYFARWFRKQTGHTPTRWRNAMQDR